MSRLKANNIETFYEDDSPSKARPRGTVVLIHGHSADHTVWQYQLRTLLSAGYRTVRYDVRGHGRSSIPPSGYSWENYSTDLAALLDHLNIDAAQLIGSSMGGGIALQHALDRPQTIRSLTLVDTALPGFTYSDEFTSQIEQLVDAVRSDGPRSAFERLWLPHVFFDGIRRFPDRFKMLSEIVLAYPAADYREGAVLESYQPNITDRLHEIAAPTLVIVGENDISDFRLVAEILGANLPNARQFVMPNCWHLPMLEKPDEFNEALLAFLGTLP